LADISHHQFTPQKKEGLWYTSIAWAFRDPAATKGFSASLYVPVGIVARNVGGLAGLLKPEKIAWEAEST
jgi:hypothetical protein